MIVAVPVLAVRADAATVKIPETLVLLVVDHDATDGAVLATVTVSVGLVAVRLDVSVTVMTYVCDPFVHGGKGSESH